MTPAELWTAAQGLHLNDQILAEMLGVEDRTVRRWRAGQRRIPAGVAEELARLEAEIDRIAGEHVASVKQLAADQGGLPSAVALLLYRDSADVEQWQPGFVQSFGWPGAASLHAAVVTRVRRDLMRFGIAIRVVWMDSERYAAWLAETGAADSPATRAAWAAIEASGED